MISDSINNQIVKVNFQDDNKSNEMQISSLLHDHEDSSIASEEDILELEQYINNNDVDCEDLKLKASKLIKLVKIKERDLLLAAQIGQSLLDANINMQKQLKQISSNNEEKSIEKYEEPEINQKSVSSFNQPITRIQSYDISSYTDNLEKVNSKLQDQVEKLEQSMKQNEQQNSKRILLLESLLEQLQSELVELQSMNTELENEKKMLIEERLSSRKMVETNEENTDTIISQLLVHKKKLVNTVNDLENKKRYLEDELYHALNDESKLERELRKLKREAEAGNRFKELYKQQSDKVNELENSIINYRKNVRRISMGIFDINNESTKNYQGMSDEDEESLSLTSTTLISKSNQSKNEISTSSSTTSSSRHSHSSSMTTMTRDNSLLSFHSLEEELEELKEEEEEEEEGKEKENDINYYYTNRNSVDGEDEIEYQNQIQNHGRNSSYIICGDQKEGEENDIFSGDFCHNENENLDIISGKDYDHHHHHHHNYSSNNDFYSKNGSGIVVIQGRINENERGRNQIRERYRQQENNINETSQIIEEEIENINNDDENKHTELVLRARKCNKCGKQVPNVPVKVKSHGSHSHSHQHQHQHQGKSKRSHSRVMKARARRTAISRKRHSVLVPINSTGEEDEEQLTVIDTTNSSFIGIYKSCKAAIERMDNSKLEITKSQTAWKFIQFWFAMLCIFVGCIVLSYRKVFPKNAKARNNRIENK